MGISVSLTRRMAPYEIDNRLQDYYTGIGGGLESLVPYDYGDTMIRVIHFLQRVRESDRPISRSSYNMRRACEILTSVHRANVVTWVPKGMKPTNLLRELFMAKTQAFAIIQDAISTDSKVRIGWAIFVVGIIIDTYLLHCYHGKPCSPDYKLELQKKVPHYMKGYFKTQPSDGQILLFLLNLP
jgi:hypothetical protein